MSRTKPKTEVAPPADKPLPAATAAKKDKPKGTDGKAGAPAAREVGGRDGPDPTRYGDWEKNGRCVDF